MSNKILQQWIILIGITATTPLFQTILQERGYAHAIAKTSVEIDNIAEVVPVSATKLDRQQQFTSIAQNASPKAQNTSPKAEEYNRLAKNKYEKGDYQGALDDYNHAIQLDPNYARAYANRGGLKILVFKDYQGALVDLNRAIQVDPNSAQAYISRGGLKTLTFQDYRGALADLNRAIQIDPNDIDAYNNRAALKYHKLKDRAGGIADLQKLAKLVQQRGNQKDAQRAMEAVRQWQLETKKAGSV
jgi:tetratricopeptide (TPR) repeat protein